MSLDAAETGELRTLHEKAYARDGALTPAEGARMRELERRRRDADTVAAVPPGRTTPVSGRDTGATARVLVDGLPRWNSERGATAPVENPAGSDAQRPRPAVSTADPAAPAVSAAEAFRRWWRTLTVASATLVLAGFGVGWLLFGQATDDSLPLTDAQADRQSALYGDEGYDAGSVRAIGQEEDALVWYASRDGGELTCIVLDVGEESRERCLPTDAVRAEGISVFLSAPVRGAESGESEQVTAFVLHSTEGAPMASILRMSTRASGGWLDQSHDRYDGHADELTDEGQRLELGGEHGDPIEVGTEP